MKNKTTERFLKNYNDKEFFLQQKVKIILSVCAVVFIFSLIFILVSVIENRSFPVQVYPTLIANISSIILIYILYKGYYSVVAHSIILILFITVWSTTFLDQGPVLQVMDSTILAMAVLALTPLITQRHKTAIIIYFFINTAALIVFSLYAKTMFSISNNDIAEYLLDNIAAFSAISLISYHIFNTNYKALSRALSSENKILSQKQEIESINQKLQASVQELETANISLESMNKGLLMTQSSLEEAKVKLKKAQEVARIGNWEYDLGTGFFSAQKDTRKMLGLIYNSPETRLEDIAALVDSSQVEESLRAFNDFISLKRRELNIEFIVHNPVTGRHIHMHAAGEMLYDDSGIPVKATGILQDITEIKQAELDLKKNEELLRATLDSTTDGILVVDENGKISHCNQRFVQMWKIPGNFLNIKNYKEFYKLTAEQMQEPDDFIKSAKKIYNSENYNSDIIKFKDGRIFSRFSCPINSSGRIKSRVWFFRDITVQTRDENELQEEKELLDITLRSIGDGVITTDIMHNIVLMNRTAEELTGWKYEEAAGRPIMDIFNIINRETGKPHINPVRRVLETEQTVELDKHTILIHRDGSRRIIENSASPIRDKSNNLLGAVVIFRDITEKEFIESELQKLHQIESLGVVAGGIAHDFNNLLSAILGNISVAKLKTISEEERMRCIEDAEKASIRASNLTGQLLTFSKGGSPVKETASIKEVIIDSVNFTLSGSNIKCNYNFPNNLWRGNIDRGQIGQVMQNLVINAKQAMPQGGIIDISAENALIQKGPLPLKSGNYVKITIRDRGIGIPSFYLDRIFEPYFSTKKEGHGLGLSVVFSIIKGHDGHITVQSEKGAGSIFTVYLPASMKSEARETEINSRPYIGKGKILFMDDEETVRKVAGKMFMVLGCEFQLASDGSEAIKAYTQAKESNSPFDVVILDITVPGGMGGKETIKKLLEIDPDIKAVISSGYTNDPAMADYRSFGFKAIASKPYRLEEMNDVLQKILNIPAE